MRSQLRASLFLPDSVLFSKPISRPINHPSEVQTTDELNSLKGTSLVLMIFSFLGPDVFNRGLANFIRNEKYGHARPVSSNRLEKEPGRIISK